MTNELIARIKAATGPDRGLDAEIAEAVSAVPEGYGRAVVHGCTLPYWWHKTDSHAPHFTPPAYTASIDAALTLVPDGWDYRFERHTDLDNKRFVTLWTVESEGEFDCKGRSKHSLALAVCAAALRVKESSHE